MPSTEPPRTLRSVRAAFLLAAGLLALATQAGGALAQDLPEVRVRGSSHLALELARADGRRVVEGRLGDELGHPLAGRRVHVRVRPLRTEPGAAPSERTVHTDARGRFRIALGDEAPAYEVVAHFPGDAYHPPADAKRRVRRARAPVELALHLPHEGRLDLSRPAHALRVRATSAAGAAGITVALRNEEGTRLATGTTGADGEITLRVDTAALGEPGAGRWQVRSRPDGRRAAATASTPIVRYRPTRLTLRAERRSRGTVLARGRLHHGAGPLPDRAVGLYRLARKDAGAEGAHLATVLTDGEGRFRHRLQATSPAGSPLRLQARFEGDGPGHPAARSDPVVLTPSYLARMPRWAWMLVPILLCLGAYGWLGRRRDAGTAADPEATTGGAAAGVHGGAQAATRAVYTGIAGRVLDVRDGRPLPQATVTLSAPDTSPRTLTLDAQGAFAAAELSAGTWHLEAEAPGYATERTSVVVPHRGEANALHVRLESLRDRALAPFRRLAERLLPPTTPWAVRTDREVVAEARRQGRGDRALEALHARVEHARYGAHPPSPDEVTAIEDEVNRILEDSRV